MSQNCFPGAGGRVNHAAPGQEELRAGTLEFSEMCSEGRESPEGCKGPLECLAGD